MEPAAAPAPAPVAAEPPDLEVLERIEGELHAVERALEQIDAGVYDGFAGLDAPSVEAPSTEAPSTEAPQGAGPPPADAPPDAPA
jgi:hypothetical protein